MPLHSACNAQGQCTHFARTNYWFHFRLLLLLMMNIHKITKSSTICVYRMTRKFLLISMSTCELSSEGPGDSTSELSCVENRIQYNSNMLMFLPDSLNSTSSASSWHCWTIVWAKCWNWKLVLLQRVLDKKNIFSHCDSWSCCFGFYFFILLTFFICAFSCSRYLVWICWCFQEQVCVCFHFRMFFWTLCIWFISMFINLQTCQDSKDIFNSCKNNFFIRLIFKDCPNMFINLSAGLQMSKPSIAVSVSVALS